MSELSPPRRKRDGAELATTTGRRVVGPYDVLADCAAPSHFLEDVIRKMKKELHNRFKFGGYDLSEREEG